MKFSELQNKDINELNEVLKDTRIRLGKLKFELASKSLKDFSQIKKNKTEVAQIMTAINKKNNLEK